MASSTTLVGSAAAAAYNTAHDRLAVFDHTARLCVWARDHEWSLISTLAVEGFRLTCLTFAPARFGGVIAGGAADGSVAVWQEAAGGDQAWRLAAALKESTLAVQALAFAPPELGTLLAVAYADGFVRLFDASDVLAASQWELQNYFKIGGSSSSGGGAATALSWRQKEPGLPPLLLVGTAQAGAEIWLYQEQLMRWELAASLGSAQEYSGRPVVDVAWAPTLGRPYDIVAVAAGSVVILWKLNGTADSLQVEQLARLQHAAGVVQLEWNLLGNWLAVSTEGGEVCMWRPDLSGEWLLLNRILGGQQANGAV